MSPAHRRAVRIVGAVLLGLGLVVAASTVAATAWLGFSDAGPPPFVRHLASVPTGLGLLVVGLGLLVRSAGRES